MGSKLDDPFEIHEDSAVQHLKWHRFLFYTRKRVSSYVAAPDAEVFNWDSARLDAVEKYSRSAGSSIMRRPARRHYEVDVETKKILVMVCRIKARLLAGENKEIVSCLQETALEEIRTVVSARKPYERRGNNIVLTGAMTAVPLFFLSPVLVSLWVNSHRGWWLLLLWLAEWTAVVILISLILWRPRWRWRVVPSSGVFLVCVASAVIIAVRYHNGNPGLLLEFSAGIGTISLLIILEITVIRALVEIAAVYRGQGAQPEAVLFVDLVSLVAAAMEWEIVKPWENLEPAEVVFRQMRQADNLMRKLESSAKRAERIFPYAAARKGESPWIQQWSINRGRQVAAVIRKHEERVLEVSTTQRALISTSLLNGLVYLLNRNWESLLVVEPQQPVKPLVRRYAPRVALATLLVVLAFLLPALLPTVIKDPVSFEATVLVTAGFALIAPDVQQAADAVRSFGK